jgi:serine/threonine-protein kinase
LAYLVRAEKGTGTFLIGFAVRSTCPSPFSENLVQSTAPYRRVLAPLHITPEMHPGYRLRRVRGRGSFGQVWEAETDAGELVALKFLPCVGDQAGMEIRSLRWLRDLSHPGLIRIDKVWSAAGCLVVAMELADGSLADLLEVYHDELGTALPRDHLLPLLSQAAEALDFLNTCQRFSQEQWVTLQHCDVTPNNLLVFDKTIKLSDFGLTTALTGREKTHVRAGTPAFAGPEVFQGRVSERTDQYALAVCYCVLRSGRLPFPDTPADFDPAYVRPSPELDMLDPEERPVILRALAPTPQDRWPSCGELLDRLARAATPTPAPSLHLDRRRTPRYRTEKVVCCEILRTMGNQSWRADVLDVSAGGLRLRVYQPGCPLRPGRVLELELVKAAEGLRVPVRLRLTHSTEYEDGTYEVGGTFARPLDAMHLQSLSDISNDLRR